MLFNSVMNFKTELSRYFNSTVNESNQCDSSTLQVAMRYVYCTVYYRWMTLSVVRCSLWHYRVAMNYIWRSRVIDQAQRLRVRQTHYVDLVLLLLRWVDLRVTEVSNEALWKCLPKAVGEVKAARLKYNAVKYRNRLVWLIVFFSIRASMLTKDGRSYLPCLYVRPSVCMSACPCVLLENSKTSIGARVFLGGTTCLFCFYFVLVGCFVVCPANESSSKI